MALAAHLSAAGHRVCACSHAFYRSTFDTLGIEFVPLGPPIDQETIQAVGEKAAREKHPLKQMAVLRDFHLLDGRDHYNRCREATKGFDVAVCHALHTVGQAAVMDNGLPWLRVMLEPSLLPTVYAAPTPLPDFGRHLNRLLWYLLERLHGQDGRSAAPVARGCGKQADPHEDVPDALAVFEPRRVLPLPL